MARHHAELGDHDRAACVGDNILKVDPYNEETLSIVLAAHAGRGDYGAGEHRYREYRNMLETELGEQLSVKIETEFRSLHLDRTGSVGLK